MRSVKLGQNDVRLRDRRQVRWRGVLSVHFDEPPSCVVGVARQMVESCRGLVTLRGAAVRMVVVGGRD